MKHIIEYFFLSYGLFLFLSYFLMAILAIKAIKRYKKNSSLINESLVKGAKDLPSVTLVAPAYNEGLTIITNVYSLLSIQYPNYQLIITNDGSTDDSLRQLITEFNLVGTKDFNANEHISCAPIKKIYKSANPKYANLTIVDKENGGRADALNAGIGQATTNLVLCTDADCIIEQGALLKMVRPYLEELDQEIIACGGAIGIANDSIIANGTLKDIKIPKSMIARIQVIEYMRSFLISRMAWGHINGLMLVSGAFGMYPRKRLLEVGGFHKDTVGEDLELCIRLRTLMEKLKKPYKVVYIPDTLCWTEAPPTYKVYISQRDRWARGLVETIGIHKKLFMNPRYGNMGKYIFPYWCIFELGAPLMELLGILFLIIFGFLGLVNWPSAIIIFCCVYLISCLYSTMAILLHVRNFPHYSRSDYVIKLLLASYTETFLSHPVMLYAQIKGFSKKLFRIKSSWGTMTRAGFNTNG